MLSLTLSLSLSLSLLLPLLPSSPRRSLPLFLPTAQGQKARVQAKKVRRGRGATHHIFMRGGRGCNGRAMKPGKGIFLDLAKLMRIRPNRPRALLFLANRARIVTSHPQTPRHIRPQRRQAPFRLLEKPPQKAHPPLSADGRGISPTRFLSD